VVLGLSLGSTVEQVAPRDICVVAALDSGLPLYCFMCSILPNFGGCVKRERSFFSSRGWAFADRSEPCAVVSLTLDLYIVAHLAEAVKHVVSVFFK
jgi:hypothetical protein